MDERGERIKERGMESGEQRKEGEWRMKEGGRESGE